MNLAASLRYDICTPIGAFPTSTDTTNTTAEDNSDDVNQTQLNYPVQSWRVSPVNPLNRINSLEPLLNPKWRIDGCDNQGTRFFAVPTFLLPKLTPLRIDVFIPSQAEHKPEIRNILQLDYAFCLRDRRVNRLGVSQHILRLLEHWTARFDDFHEIYYTLPFGSHITIDKLLLNIEDINVQIVPNVDLSHQILSLEALQALWKLPHETWPNSLRIQELQYHRRMHDSITLVRIPHLHPSQCFVFKSNTTDLGHMYHELKIPLTMAPHPNIMPRPLFLVTCSNSSSTLDKVCGFILRQYSQESFGDILSERALQGSLIFKNQIHWALQILKTLIAINNSPAQYYSELKPDNLLLSVTGTQEDVIFIDFEHHNGWITFAPPEVNNQRFCLRLSKSNRVPKEKREKYLGLLHYFMPPVPKKGPLYADTDNGYSAVWNSLTRSEQEAAEVFSFGKILWCIFEGCKDTRNSVQTVYSYDSGQEFPNFRKTPENIRALIKQCTAGCPDWRLKRGTGIIRLGSKVYPRGRTGTRGEPLASAYEAMGAVRSMWQERVEDMEIFLETKRRWRNGVSSREDQQLLGFPARPSLQCVGTLLRQFKAGTTPAET